MTRPERAEPVASDDCPWADVARPVAERVDELIQRMTLEEKVAQLGSRWLGASHQDLGAGHGVDADDQANPALNVAPMQDVFAAGGGVPLEEASRHGLGHLTRVYGSAPVSVAEGAGELVRQQHVVLANSRLRVPALVHEECLTGFT